MSHDALLQGEPETAPGIGKLRNALMQKIAALSNDLGAVAHSVPDPPASQVEAIEQTKEQLEALEAKANHVTDALGAGAELGPAFDDQLVAYLARNGATSERDLARHLERTDVWDLAARAEGLSVQDLIEQTAGSSDETPLRHWQVTDKGRETLGIPAPR